MKNDIKGIIEESQNFHDEPSVKLAHLEIWKAINEMIAAGRLQIANLEELADRLRDNFQALTASNRNDDQIDRTRIALLKLLNLKDQDPNLPS